nr:hypothetical protein [Tanacetum cinerariifolium]
MALTFADTHNWIACLTKSDASEWFDQIIDFLNASSIKYALTVNPNIYVLCIKQFFSSVLMKKVNDVMRLQDLVDKKKVIITKATIREALQLDDAESIDFLPNEEIFTELSRMGYEKTSTKLTFYKAFFSPQWKFLIHTILQCMRIQVDDLSVHTTKYSSHALTQKVFANTRRVGKGFSRVETPLFKGMMVAYQVDDIADEGVAGVNVDDIPATDAEPSIPSPPPTTQSPPPSQDQEQPTTSQVIPTPPQSPIYADEDVTLKDVTAVEKTAKIEENADVQGRQPKSQAQIYKIDLEHADKVLSMHDDELEPVELQEAVEVVSTAKLMTEVVTAASATTTTADTLILAGAITTAPSAARKRKRVVIRDPEETVTPSIVIHSEPKSKDKGKGIMVEEPKPLKKQAQIEQDEAYARELESELKKNIDWDKVIEQVQRKEKEDNAVMSYDDVRPIFKKYFNFNVDFLEKTKEQMEEEDNRALKRASKTQAEKAAKKKKLDEEVEELKKHLQIVPNNDDDVYTKATHLALKVPVVDYAIHTENNKPYFKNIRAGGTHQLYLSFLRL